MLSNGFIDKAQYDEAIAEAIVLKRADDPETAIYAAPYFVAHVKKELQRKFSPAVVFKGGLVVYDDTRHAAQEYAESAVKSRLSSKERP